MLLHFSTGLSYVSINLSIGIVVMILQKIIRPLSLNVNHGCNLGKRLRIAVLTEGSAKHCNFLRK